MDTLISNLVGGTGLAAALATAYFLVCRPRALKSSISLDEQAKILEGSGDVHASKLRDELLRYLHEDAQTVYEAMLRGLKHSRKDNCLGWRETATSPYTWNSYEEVYEKITNYGCGLVKLGCQPGTNTYIGIYAQNCREWIICEHACYRHSMVTVPLYDTLGPAACSFIINQAEISTIICDKEAKVESLLAESTLTPKLKQIIVIFPVSDAVKQRAKQFKINLILFSDVEKLGESNPVESLPPKPIDLATVCYTSGTTGHPKGVMLTHANIMSNVSAVMLQLGDVAPRKEDVMISFLPLAHMLERCCETAVYMEGGSIGFYYGDIRKLNEDMLALRPTMSPCVPRLLNRIYDKVQARAQGSLVKRSLLRLAYNMKLASLQKQIITNSTIWDWLVFKPVREAMGGRIRLMVIGSAPIAGNVLTFIRCALGCVIVEGYGQTESTCPCTLTLPGDYNVDHVGPPLSCANIKLVDVPEMEYYASQGKGEICVSGPIVFKGYLNDPEKTAEVIDDDGWLHTGDIGMWLPNGTIRIVDRKKYIFKLSQGEYVAPEKIENIYLRSKLVSQIFIHGESLKSCLVGIIVPDEDFSRRWAQKNGFSKSSIEDLCNIKEFKKALLTDLLAIGKEAKLNSFEQVKDIYLFPKQFQIENGLLTPTLKTKRPEALKMFKGQIEKMYAQLA